MYTLIVFYGILSILIGTGVSIGITIWKFGFKRELWYSWLLGGIFWSLAIIIRAIPLLILVQSLLEFGYSRWIVFFFYALFAGVFETLFRVFLLLLFTRETADTKEKLIMAGLGWGTVEAILLHTLPIINLLTVYRNTVYVLSYDGIEYILLYRGIERLITEVFHLIMMIMVFYGIKSNLKNIERSEPITDNIFTKDPNPTWLWILIVMGLHFAYNFLALIFLRLYNFITMYILISSLVAILMFYIILRIKAYPLFPESQPDD